MDHTESDFEETYPYNSMYEGEKRARKKRVSYKEPDEEEDFEDDGEEEEDDDQEETEKVVKKSSKILPPQPPRQPQPIQTAQYKIQKTNDIWESFPKKLIQENFEKRSSELNQELLDIAQGTHEEYKKLNEMITQERDDAILQAQLFRDYQIECATRLFKVDHENCLAEYLAEKEGLKEKMLLALDEKKRKLKDTADAFNPSMNEVSDKPNTRKIRNPPPRLQEERVSRNKKTKAVTPSLATLLRDHEIYDDISYFRKMGISGRRFIKK